MDPAPKHSDAGSHTSTDEVATRAFGQTPGLHYLTMTYLEGQTLGERLRQGPTTAQEAISLIGKLAAAMQAAHATSILHRDLTPANVLLTPDGEPVIMDFGLARREGG